MPGSNDNTLGKPLTGWRLQVYTVIFEADTRAGRLFDQWLIALILVSVSVVVVSSVESIGTRHTTLFNVLEWFFTVAFTVEYVARLVCVRHPLRYALSFLASSTCWPCSRRMSPCWCPRSMHLLMSACCGCCGCFGFSS